MQKVYKQKYYHSCFVASLLMAGGLEQKLEEKIFLSGDVREYYCYIDSIMAHFVKATGLKLECLVDDKYLTEIFQKSLMKQKDEIELKFQMITADLVSKLIEKQPVVVHLDDNYLGDYSHCSHFVVVNKITKDGEFEILDPWDGKIKYLTPKQLDDAFLSLKNHIKMSPEVIFVKK